MILRQSRRGFGLFELVLVLIILAVLFTVIVTAMDTLRQNGQTTSCINQIRRIADSMSQYDQNYSSFPWAFNDDASFLIAGKPPGGFLGNASYDRMGWWWQNFLSPYSGVDDFYEDSIFRCPSRNIVENNLKNPLWGNYGVNQMICKSALEPGNRAHLAGNPLGSQLLPAPARLVLMADCGYNMINWAHVTNKPPYEFGNLIEDQAYLPGLIISDYETGSVSPKKFPQFVNDVSGRHENQKINILYGDGHVKTEPAESLRVTWKDGVYDRLEAWVADPARPKGR